MSRGGQGDILEFSRQPLAVIRGQLTADEHPPVDLVSQLVSGHDQCRSLCLPAAKRPRPAWTMAASLRSSPASGGGAEAATTSRVGMPAMGNRLAATRP